MTAREQGADVSVNPHFATELDFHVDILVTEPVAEVAGDVADFGRSFAMKVRGRAAHITAYEVLGSRGTAGIARR